MPWSITARPLYRPRARHVTITITARPLYRPRARHVEGHADILIAFGGQDIANNEASNLGVHALLEGSDVWVRLADFSGFAPHGKFQPNFIGTVRGAHAVVGSGKILPISVMRKF